MSLLKVFRLLVVSVAIIDLSLGKHLRSLQGNDCSTLGPEMLRETTVSMNFYGNPDALSDEDIALLAEVLKESYEVVSDDPCFDIIEIVSVDSGAARRELTSEVYDMNNRALDDEPINFDFTFVFLVSYQCFGCNIDGIYSNDGSRRRLGINYKGPTGPASPKPINKFGDKRPKRSTFTKEFNKLLISSDMSSKVAILNRVSEEKQVNECDIKTKIGKTEMSITFQGDYKTLVEEMQEINALEQGIMKAYNAMNQVNPYTCDKSFRKIERVEYRTLAPVQNDVFVMSFEASYEWGVCKNQGYGKAIGLFDKNISIFDAGRQDLFVDFQEVGPAEPMYSCDIQAKIERAPTKDEFSRALRRIIEIRTAEGKISAVTDVAQYNIVTNFWS